MWISFQNRAGFLIDRPSNDNDHLAGENPYLEKILISKSIAEYYMTERTEKTAAVSWASKALNFAQQINNAKEIDEIIKLIKEINAN